MKKMLLMLLLASPVLIFAADSATDSNTNVDNQQVKQQKFEAKKQQILKMLQEKQACVEKANSKDDLKKCKVHGGKKHKNKKD
ncbi:MULTISPECIES: hypothetical protein [Francisella]|uniref:PsiF repeat family protein n=2 Tax=Francisella TaxID=262 RepID=A0A080QBT9_9GAMM|nr:MULTISPECIES: hypothetical protein [Francisella]AJI53688.1 hypothetical protein LA55_343 [Francisella philomiragia]AJI57575.1 hypothetical protein LA02_100 [Francisella philomiragia]KFJ43793.1 hypothetical protein DR78_1215 [Francisella philomiragia]MBK2024978.1 hypothetical protein [Francisella philomiragia]MBK2254877.1 hypothetical protein [Francisella philomiragia]